MIFLKREAIRNGVAHFIGSIVFVHDDTYTTSRIRELIIIDGQQRLTTVTLIYLTVYWLAKKLNNESLSNEIVETYLINKFAAEEEKLKLRPMENNDRALKYLLRNDENEEFPDYSKLINNFNYFKGRIVEENRPVRIFGKQHFGASRRPLYTAYGSQLRPPSARAWKSSDFHVILQPEIII